MWQKLFCNHSSTCQKPKPASFAKSNSSAKSSALPLRAQGEVSFDQKAKEQRKNALRFLKGITPCSSCNATVHWSGDSECPYTKSKAKFKGATKPGAKRKQFEGETALNRNVVA